MGRPKLDITDTERYNRAKEATKRWKEKKKQDAEYMAKQQEYKRNYFQSIKNGFLEEQKNEKVYKEIII